MDGDSIIIDGYGPIRTYNKSPCTERYTSTCYKRAQFILAVNFIINPYTKLRTVFHRYAVKHVDSPISTYI